MNFILWWYYEGRPKARIKNFIKGLRFRIEGGKMQRKIRRELLSNPMPRYRMPEEYRNLKAL